MRRQALMLLAAALALTGCGGGGSAEPTTTAAPPVTTVAPTTTTATTTAPTATMAGPSQRIVPVDIKGGKPVGGIVQAEVGKGDQVELVIRSDVSDEVHLHGYDLSRDVEAGGTARIRFTAKITGVFEAELENRGLQILELTVK